MAAVIKKLLQGFKNFLKKTHYALPPGVRSIYTPALSRCSYFVQSHLNALFPMIVLYSGLERESQRPLSFIYAGDIHQMHNYWDHIILSDGFKKRSLGRRLFWKIVPEIKKKFPDCGFVIMEQSTLTIPFFKKRPGFSIPLWVRMEIDIKAPVNELFSRQRSDIERRIRKNGLSFEMTKDLQYFEDFYHEMHVPYVTKRYTDTAGINSFELFHKMIPRSEMLLIKKDGKTIAGLWVEFKDGKAHMRKLGIVDSNMEYVRFGAIGALYYFCAQELKKRGYNIMDIGGTRPFFNDGLTRYKRSLGARLSKKNNLCSCVKFMVLQNTPGVSGFLTHNPFLFKNKRKKICSAVFVENKGWLASGMLNSAITSSRCEGVAEIEVYVFGDKKIPVDPGLSGHPPVSVHSADELING